MFAAPVVVNARLLTIAQNLPGRFDRRAWLECQALVTAGYRVAFACSNGGGDRFAQRPVDYE